MRSSRQKLRFVGAQVATETRSVPLVADLNNEEGRFRPGMFVWVEVPMEQERTSLVVPPAAIMRHENQPFVFIAEDKNTFRRVDVKTGLETRDAVEIVSGLSLGQKVVSHGSFFLKSELLLEREPECAALSMLVPPCFDRSAAERRPRYMREKPWASAQRLILNFGPTKLHRSLSCSRTSSTSLLVTAFW